MLYLIKIKSKNNVKSDSDISNFSAGLQSENIYALNGKFISVTFLDVKMYGSLKIHAYTILGRNMAKGRKEWNQ